MRLRIRDQSGVTLTELLVGMAVTAAVGTMIGLAITATHRTDRYTDQDSEALASLRFAGERLTKELRQARRVYSDSTGTRIRFWVDSDRDNQQDPSERIIWQVRTAGGRTELVRGSDGGGSFALVTPYMVSGDAFSYRPSPPNTTIVRITLSADFSPGSLPAPRTIRTEVRLRNATA